MKFKFNFNLNVWVDGIEVDANNYDEAVEKLYQMSVRNYLEEGYDRESDISDIEGELLEKTVKVKVYDIDYDIEEDDYEDLDQYNEILRGLPEEMTLTVLLEADEDLTELLADEITDTTGWLVNGFNYMIIEEK